MLLFKHVLRSNHLSLPRNDIHRKFLSPIKYLPLRYCTNTPQYEFSHKTGAFRSHIPEIFEAPTYYRRALKTLSVVKVDVKIKNIRQRQRKYTSQVILQLMVGLTAPLTEILKKFQKCLATLHPYEDVVAQLTLNTRTKAGHKPLQVRMKSHHIRNAYYKLHSLVYFFVLK